jgi:hypothetical protein
MRYLVKWAGWPSKYNSCEPASHLVNAPRAVADCERKFKRKRMEAKADNIDDEEAADPEDVSAPRKRARRSRT